MIGQKFSKGLIIKVRLALSSWWKGVRNKSNSPKKEKLRQTWTYWILVLTFFAFYAISEFWIVSEVKNESFAENSTVPLTAQSNNVDSVGLKRLPENPEKELPKSFNDILSLLDSIPSSSPLSNKVFTISSTFGIRIHPIDKTKKFHNGIDMAAPRGTPVYATAHGRIRVVGNQPKGLGKFVTIQHAHGYQSIYGHLLEPLVQKGDSVVAHQMIALTGNTGKSTGPHLHYAVLKNRINLDPMPTLNLKYEVLKTRLQQEHP